MKWFAAMLLAVSVVACGNGDDENTVLGPTQQQASLTGTWKLTSINGSPLPYLLDQIGEDKLELMEAGLVATSTGTFTSTSLEQTTISGEVQSHAFSEDGRWAVQGSEVALTFNSDGATVVGTIRRDSLIFTGGGFPVVYRRQ